MECKCILSRKPVGLCILHLTRIITSCNNTGCQNIHLCSFAYLASPRLTKPQFLKRSFQGFAQRQNCKAACVTKTKFKPQTGSCFYYVPQVKGIDLGYLCGYIRALYDVLFGVQTLNLSEHNPTRQDQKQSRCDRTELTTEQPLNLTAPNDEAIEVKNASISAKVQS